jgi:poly(hydroxyalkanoate) depolymerase family esterase
MVENKAILLGVIEATRLTRAGRLSEATALIQRILCRRPASAAAVNDLLGRGGGASDDVIDAEFSEVARPVDSGLTELRTDTAGDVSQRPDRNSFFRKWHWRSTVGDAPRPQTGVSAGQPGEFIAGFFANQVGERSYKLYIPTSYAGQQLPLIVMLHGCKQTPDDFATGTRMNELAEARQCFVLYPAQARSANHSGCWNWFRRADQVRDQGEPSIIAGMTREIVNRYRIDPRKVYVAGLSAGGAMAAVMGVAYPELYAAIGIHSGLACGSAHDLPSALAAMRGMPATRLGQPKGSTPASPAIPTIVFHGDRDKTVHPRNGEQVVSQSVGGNGASCADVSIERGQVPGGHSYSRTVHHDSTGRVALEYWLVHGGGHAWFGGSPRGSYSDPKGPNAACEMVRFFFSERMKDRN